MLETMREANGVGLAAQQIGEALQLTVIDVGAAEDQASTLRVNGEEVDAKTLMPLVLLNPELTLGADSADISRASTVMARAETLEGDTVELEATGLLARALQHEVDHLQGILFVDRMSAVAKVALRSRLKRLKRENEPGR